MQYLVGSMRKKKMDDTPLSNVTMEDDMVQRAFSSVQPRIEAESSNPTNIFFHEISFIVTSNAGIHSQATVASKQRQ
jgi:hypothetical protein